MTVKRVLAAVDGSNYGWKALDLAITYAQALESELLVVHVIPGDEIPRQLAEFAGADRIEEKETEFAWRRVSMLDEKIMTEAKRLLEEKHVEHSRVLVRKGDPAEHIVYEAHQNHVQMIFIGHRGLSTAEHMLMGSVAQKVANLARCTCVIVK